MSDWRSETELKGALEGLAMIGYQIPPKSDTEGDNSHVLTKYDLLTNTLVSNNLISHMQAFNYRTHRDYIEPLQGNTLGLQTTNGNSRAKK